MTLVETRAITGIHICSCSPRENDSSLLVSLMLALLFDNRAEGRNSVRGEFRVRLEGPEEVGPADEVAIGVERSESMAWRYPVICQ